MRISLRIKLTLIALLLPLIPLFGLRFGDMIQEDLLESRRETMLFSARAVASTLSSRTDLLDREQFLSLNPSSDIYMYPLRTPIRINGKKNDWQNQPGIAKIFGKEHLVYSKNDSSSKLHFSHRLGLWKDHLYAIFEVADENVVYQRTNSPYLNRSDHLKISIEDHNKQIRHYIVTTDSPGWVNGFLMPLSPADPFAESVEPRIQGVWLETETGYNIELRIPLSLIGNKLAFSIADVINTENPEIETIISTVDSQHDNSLGKAIIPSGEIERILMRLDRPDSRVLVVDQNRKVRASYGQLSDPLTEEQEDTAILSKISSITYQLLTPLYQLFLKPFSDKVLPPQSTTLDIEGIDQALTGNSTVTSYKPGTEQTEIMAAIVPLRRENQIIGAVVVEQTTNSILALQNKLIEESITLTILTFSFGGLGMLLFSIRISSRIRDLRNQAEKAISDDGTVRTTITRSRVNDEIGDLNRTLSMMLRQLKEQNEYREKMADNLEHEMRTPLAAASASLQNLAKELDSPDERITNYLNWTISDITRMEQLLTAIRDATNLQAALEQDFKESFELDKALSVWIEHGWTPAFPQVEFLCDFQPETDYTIYGDPSRIRQMLDKIIENGVSYHKEGTPIQLGLSTENNRIKLTISNEGPTLEPDQEKQIFNSMVSVRKVKDDKPHLGLGLFIARTIVQHHGGEIRAENLLKKNGVAFILLLPIFKK